MEPSYNKFFKKSNFYYKTIHNFVFPLTSLSHVILHSYREVFAILIKHVILIAFNGQYCRPFMNALYFLHSRFHFFQEIGNLLEIYILFTKIQLKSDMLLIQTKCQASPRYLVFISGKT